MGDSVGPTRGGDPLSALMPKQRRFVEQYLSTWNAYRSAEAVGYKQPHVYATHLMRNPLIQAAIRSRIDHEAMRADEVLARLAQQARANVSMFIREESEPIFNKNGDVVGNRAVMALNWDVIQRYGYLIKSVKMTVNGPAIELHDAQAALVHIGRHHKLFSDQIEHSGRVVEVQMTVEEWKAEQARRRAEADAAAMDLGTDEQ